MASAVQVFISYSRVDSALAERLKTDLRASGATIWIDHESLPPGDPNWQHAIRRGIEASTAVIYLGSPDASQSPNVGAEIKIATSERRRIIPMWIRGDVWTRCAPFEVINANYVDARGERYPTALAGVRATLGLPTPQPATPQPAPSGWRPPAPTPTPPRPASQPTPRFPPPIVPARLASLGYQGINLTGAPAFIPPLITIPAGPFIMGSDLTRDPWAQPSETPQYWIEVETFQIAKYPVTVAEYSLAVRSGAVSEPGRSGSVAWATQQQHPDHPVVCVSWQDATAYIAWLIKTTGYQGWSLPSEARWEKAARWDEARQESRIYPWGDNFDKTRCNTSESGIGTTSPIGSYPASDARRSGASPYGVEEMAGNIWEWTSSLYKPYPYTLNDGREDPNSSENRTLRGSSWIYVALGARAASRYYGRWDGRNDGFGFRLALSPGAGS